MAHKKGKVAQKIEIFIFNVIIVNLQYSILHYNVYNLNITPSFYHIKSKKGTTFCRNFACLKDQVM